MRLKRRSDRPHLWIAAARTVLVGALCLSVGMQWVVMQGVAWTTMLISFSKGGTLIEAVEKTFDGEHPCPLCCAVKEGKAKESQRDQEEAPVKKADALLVSVSRLVAPPPMEMQYAIAAVMAAEARPPSWWQPPRV